MSNTLEGSAAIRPATIQPTLLVISLIVGAIIGLGLVLPLDPVITMPNDLGTWPLNPSPEYIARYNKAYSNMWMGNMAINFSLIGAATGTVTAILFARGASAISRMMMAVLSLLGGGIGGLITGLLLASAHSTQGRLNIVGMALDPMLQSVFFHALCWSGIGIGIGSAVALSLKQPVSKGIVGGLLGGFVAAMAHALIGSIAFPSSDVANLLPPNTFERFLWAAYSGAAVGGGIWWMLRQPQSQNVAAAQVSTNDLA